MLTSWSEVSTPAELSIESVLIRPPAARVLDPAELGEPEVAALADAAHAQVVAVDRIASLALSPTSAWVSVLAFTYVPMPPFQNRSTGAEDRPHQLGGDSG